MGKGEYHLYYLPLSDAMFAAHSAAEIAVAVADRFVGMGVFDVGGVGRHGVWAGLVRERFDGLEDFDAVVLGDESAVGGAIFDFSAVWNDVRGAAAFSAIPGGQQPGILGGTDGYCLGWYCMPWRRTGWLKVLPAGKDDSLLRAASLVKLGRIISSFAVFALFMRKPMMRDPFPKVSHHAFGIHFMHPAITSLRPLLCWS